MYSPCIKGFHIWVILDSEGLEVISVIRKNYRYYAVINRALQRWQSRSFVIRFPTWLTAALDVLKLYLSAEMDTSTKKLLRSKSGLRIVVVNDRFKSPFVLSEPQWSPDGENESCFRCKAKFDFITRKHHCRRCGQVYCKACCYVKEVLPRMCFVDPVRLCTGCENVARKEKAFFDVHLKTLLNGAKFQLSLSGFPQGDDNDFFTCRLSNDHRHVIFDGSPSICPEPLPFVEIKSVSIVRSSDEDQNAENSLAILHRKPFQSDDTQILLSCMALSLKEQRQSLAWMSAMLEAFKMVYECS